MGGVGNGGIGGKWCETEGTGEKRVRKRGNGRVGQKEDGNEEKGGKREKRAFSSNIRSFDLLIIKNDCVTGGLFN